MFSLIITIISIALVAALALATLYYGGSAFNKGAAGAAASRLINDGQQINGAVTLAKADVAAAPGTSIPADLTALVTSSYLASVPSSFQGTQVTSGTEVTASVATKEVCEEIAKRSGHTLDADGLKVGTGNGVFSCGKVTATDTTYTFSYKL